MVPSRGQDIPFFTIAKILKKKLGAKDTKEQSFEFKCEKCHYQHEMIDKMSG